MIRGEPERFWDRVGGGDTSREIRWLATDSRQSLHFAASGILGSQWISVGYKWGSREGVQLDCNIEAKCSEACI